MSILVHPAIVHFPIALLLAAAFFEALALIFRKPVFRTLSLGNGILGALGAAVAVATGLRAEEIAPHAEAAHELIEKHQTLGILTLSLSLAVVFVRLLTRDRWTGLKRAVIAALIFVAALSVTAGAYLGGAWFTSLESARPILFRKASPATSIITTLTTNDPSG